MTKRFSIAQRNQWKEKILSQQQSGLPISSWCRQNNIPIHNFYYWKGKLFPKPSLDQSSFVELQDNADKNAHSSIKSISIDIHRIRIQADPQMDNSNLKQLIAELKGILC